MPVCLKVCDRHPSFEIAAPAKQGCLHYWQFPRRTTICELLVVSKIPYVYDFITKVCRQEAVVIQNHDNEHVAKFDKVNHNTGHIRGSNLAAVKRV
jgi:hypothetical protein